MQSYSIIGGVNRSQAIKSNWQWIEESEYKSRVPNAAFGKAVESRTASQRRKARKARQEELRAAVASLPSGQSDLDNECFPGGRVRLA